MKAAYYPDVGLEQMVLDQMWIEKECKYDIAAMYGISHWWFQIQRCYIDRHTSEGDRRAVRTHMQILGVVRIEVFSMYGYDYLKKIGDPQQKEYKEKGVIDSDGKGRISGKDPQKSLTLLFYVQGDPQQKEYKEKGVIDSDGKGRISGKGKIKTGKLDFNDVYFSTVDESNLWHKRLGYINFKTMNKLVKGNLVRGIKREYNVARTPLQNVVAERRNKTLIKATRTMLVDSKLPTTFWAEVVNTACYVLNRALVTKPHNKTPYEIIRGRPPLIDFMKPFGYLLLLDIKLMVTGTKEKLVASQDEKKKELEQEYIQILICITGPLISQDAKDSAEDVGKKAPEVDSVSTAGQSFVNAASQIPLNVFGPSTSTNAFEEHFFERFSSFNNAFSLPHVPMVTLIDDTGIVGNAYDDDVLEKEVDMNNVD
nr:ribonuclease H-like domain-containing protein [Tanacetum cinerariifolium]